MSNAPTIPKRFPSQVLDQTLAYIDGDGVMMLQLELEFAEQLDADRLARATHLALDAEPVLGCRFVHHWRKPYWERLPSDNRHVYVTAHTGAEFEAFKVSAIDTYTIPQIRVCLWNPPQGAHLIIKVSHFVSDAAGTKDVARIISTMYSELSRDPDYQPQPNLSGSRGVGQLLGNIPRRRYPGLFLQALRDSRTAHVPLYTQTLPFQNEPAESPLYVHRFLPRERVSRLVEYGQTHNATLNDLLIVAFLRALAVTSNWNGDRQLRLNTTVDMRRYMSERKASAVTNLSDAIPGWPSLGTDIGHDFSSALDRITPVTQKRKQNFLGVDGLLVLLIAYNLLPHSWITRLMKRGLHQIKDEGNFANSLTNTGAIDPATITFGAKPIAARLLPPLIYPPYFMLGASGYDGTLTLSAGIYSHQEELAGRFLDAMLVELPS